jgi:hypothetical protein
MVQVVKVEYVHAVRHGDEVTVIGKAEGQEPEVIDTLSVEDAAQMVIELERLAAALREVL